jgi:hypothetical protein
MAVLKQSTAYTRMFLLVQSSDHITGLTGATPVVKLSKAGGAGAAAGGTITEVDATNMPGWYKIALTTTDTNTLGELAYHCTAASADPTDFADQVSAVSLSDLLFDANGFLKVDVEAWHDILVSDLPANFFALSIDSSGSIAVQSNVKKNQACAGFTFTMIDATTKEPSTGLAITATRRQDGGAATLCDNSVVELANGIYAIDFTANDMNANKITFRFTAAGADDTVVELVTVP